MPDDVMTTGLKDEGTEFCLVQRSLYVQLLRSPILAALLHGTSAAGALVKLCGVVQRMELRNFRRQRHLYSAMGRAAIMLDKERNLGNPGIRRDHPTSSDRSEILLGGSPSRDSSKVQISSKSVKRFRAIGGRNVAIPIDLAIGLYNSLDYRTSRNDIIGTSGRPRLESATEL